MAKREAMAEQKPAADSPGEFCVFVKTLRDKTFAVQCLWVTACGSLGPS